MTFDPKSAAGWLAEAWETGNPLAPLPPGLAPRNEAEGEAIAGALVEALGQPVIGLRLAPGPAGEWLAGPILESRLLRAGTPVALAAFRHVTLSAGLLCVLEEPLGDAPPAFRALHPALDLAAERWASPAATAAGRLADLNGLGLVLVGKRSAAGAVPATGDCRIGRTGERPKPLRTPLAEHLDAAVAAARRWGGLPAGSLLLVAGLGGSHAPAAGEKWSAAVPPIGRISAAFG